jgi:hypothetical protein
MSAFLPNIPQAGDFLDSTSQPQLLSNNQALDARFGVDHYKYSDATGQSGKHNKVTTPVFIDSPPTGLPPVIISTEPVIAAFQQTVPVGVLQYSYGWNVAAAAQAVPTPITMIHSQSTGLSMPTATSINLLDFTGLPRAIAVVYGASFTDNASMTAFSFLIPRVVYWNGASFNTFTFPAASFQITTLGNVLRITNGSAGTLNNVYWTLQMIRMQ